MPLISNNFLHRTFDRVNRLLDVKNRKSSKAITLLAIAVFFTGLVFSLQHLDGRIEAQFTLGMIGGMFGLLCLTFLTNSCRTHAHSRIVGAGLSFAENAKLSLFGSALNMLPLIVPAGMYMRMSNFVRHGGQLGEVAGVLVTNYLLALLSSLTVGIGLLYIAGSVELRWPFVAILIMYIGLGAFFVRLAGLKLGLIIAALELGAVAIDAVRILLCFGMLGFSIEIFQAAILTVSAILGSAVSIVPAGLGVRELVGAAISPLIQVAPEQTYLAIALNRVFGMLFFAGLSGLILWLDRSKQ